MVTAEQKQHLLAQLRNELTEAQVYTNLAACAPLAQNAAVLRQIAAEERAHAALLQNILQTSAAPNRGAVFYHVMMARIFGLTFALKLMERGEGMAEQVYRQLASEIPELQRIAEDEERHEAEILAMLDDERLNYMGAIVLGLNDALVELTGALAGFTFALSSSRQIAMTGLITGLAAAMSMAASAFLSAKADGEREDQHAGKTACYTGIAYVITVFILVTPYFVFSSVTWALPVMLTSALGIIAFFNFYLSVAKEISFRRSFLQMASISTTVALISFGIGYVLQHTLGAH